MHTIIYTCGMVLLWLINLLNGTGIGNAYRTTEYARLIAVAIILLLMALRVSRNGQWRAAKRYFYVLLPMTLLFVAMPLLKGNGLVGLNYLWVFLVTYLLSQTRPDRKTLLWVGAAYAVLGLAILFIFNYMDALDGWNPNSIAMIGLFSYLVFIIPYYGAKDWQSKIMLTLVGAAYVALIWPTDSRSCSIAVVIALLLVFRVIPAEKTLNSRKKIFWALQIPLIIALLGCLITLSADVEALNNWSLDKLGKTFFSGRDQAWLKAFETLLQNPLFGTGYVDSGIYHNSAVACLIAFGVVGYILWVRLFYIILCDVLPFQVDECIMGATTAFFVIFWQQSVELGLFAPKPNLIPYVVLGLILGRARCIRERENTL